MVSRKTASLSRRNLLKSASVLGGVPPLSASQNTPKGRMTVRDRFWMYGQEAGAQNGHYGLPGKSYISEAEAAFYLSIPNLILGFCHRKPETLSQYRQLAVACRPFKRVVGSIVGCSGETDANDRDLVLQLASETPNITGVIMDDFFRHAGVGALTVEELRQVQQRLKGGNTKLDLWVVLYDKQLEEPVSDYLALCDVITFWSLSTLHDLEQMPSSFAKLEKLAPMARKMLGCYMYNFGESKPMPVSAMKFQCELALGWLQQGRIEGVIFDESDICDFGFDAVEWTRDWIRQVGDQQLVVKR
jgi:hypothetical protein